MRMLLTVTLGSAALALAVAACGGSSGSAVVKVSTFPWPEGPGPVVAAIRSVPGIYVPLSKIKAAIPKTWPKNPPQTCRYGAKVQIALKDGRTFAYGPCNRPGSIERLRLALIKAARHP